METTDIDTVIVGAGQAGLSTGYHLQRRGIPFVILDASTRLGDNWRRQCAVELDQLATVAGLAGHHDEFVRALQRAFVRSLDEGNARPAVRCAFRLAMSTASHGEQALSAGWLSRAAELVDEIGEDCAERGWVAFLRMFRAIGTGDFAEAQVRADEANSAGRRFHDADLIAISTCAQGRVAL